MAKLWRRLILEESIFLLNQSHLRRIIAISALLLAELSLLIGDSGRKML